MTSREAASADGGAPDLSICIPVGRSAQVVARIVQALHGQAFHGSIILVADPSQTEELLRACPGSSTADILVLPSSDHESPAKRNIAVAAARSGWCAFLDDDVQLADDYVAALEDLTAAHRNEDVVIQGCPYAGVNDRAWLSAGESRLYEARLRRALSADGGLAVCDARNLVIPRRLALSYPFNEQMRSGGIGHELASRLRADGYRVLFEPRLMVRHRHRETIRSLFAQKSRHGRGRAALLGKGWFTRLRFVATHFSSPTLYLLRRDIPVSLWPYAMLCALAFCLGALTPGPTART